MIPDKCKHGYLRPNCKTCHGVVELVAMNRAPVEETVELYGPILLHGDPARLGPLGDLQKSMRTSCRSMKSIFERWRRKLQEAD
jgi:hypothetical protein